MTDPFDGLRSPAPPVAPDPAFAAALRTRLERALLDLPEVPMTSTETRIDPHALTPYLAVVDARAAVEFYVTAFGARRRGEPIVMPDGRVGHVEVGIGDSVLMLADEYPELGLLAPATRGGVSQSVVVEVPDPDGVVDRAVAAGGVLERPVADSPHGRGGVVIDPSGHRWMVSREPAAPRAGEIVYASLWTPDVARAQAFYTAVLGWTTVGSGPGTRVVTNAGIRLGLHGEHARPTLMACYAVPDVVAAVALVRAAGGRAGDPVADEHGRVADCVDDQGLPFAVWEGQLGAGDPTPGDLASVELRVPDAGRARAFYGTVLGWRFRPGAQAGYWHMEVGGAFTAARSGLSGGHDEPGLVPTFAVADLAKARNAVHAAGGRAADPVPGQPGGPADCTDDQGTSFRLLQR